MLISDKTLAMIVKDAPAEIVKQIVIEYLVDNKITSFDNFALRLVDAIKSEPNMIFSKQKIKHCFDKKLTQSLADILVVFCKWKNYDAYDNDFQDFNQHFVSYFINKRSGYYITHGCSYWFYVLIEDFKRYYEVK